MGTHPIFESDFDCLTDCQFYYFRRYRRSCFGWSCFVVFVLLNTKSVNPAAFFNSPQNGLQIGSFISASNCASCRQPTSDNYCHIAFLVMHLALRQNGRQWRQRPKPMSQLSQSARARDQAQNWRPLLVMPSLQHYAAK